VFLSRKVKIKLDNRKQYAVIIGMRHERKAEKENGMRTENKYTIKTQRSRNKRDKEIKIVAYRTTPAGEIATRHVFSISPFWESYYNRIIYHSTAPNLDQFCTIGDAKRFALKMVRGY
jgi:hypothetical protein